MRDIHIAVGPQKIGGPHFMDHLEEVVLRDLKNVDQAFVYGAGNILLYLVREILR